MSQTIMATAGVKRIEKGENVERVDTSSGRTYTRRKDQAKCDKQRPGLFFGPGCSLAWDTPKENIRMLIDCASWYGSYTGRGTHAGENVHHRRSEA